MKQCIGCEAEMAAETKNCPQCGADQRGWSGRRRKLIATTFLLCMPLLGVAGALYLHSTAYDNCGLVAGPNGTGEDLVRARETCLWEQYREGKRGMLTAVNDYNSNLFTVDPADQAAPIHDEINIRCDASCSCGADTSPGACNAGSVTCRAMLRTASGLQMEGCSGHESALLTNISSILFLCGGDSITCQSANACVGVSTSCAIQFTPVTATAGGTVTVNGSGWPGGAPVILYVDFGKGEEDLDMDLASATSSDGSFTATVTLPRDIRAGSYTVGASDMGDMDVATQTLTVASPHTDRAHDRWPSRALGGRP